MSNGINLYCDIGNTRLKWRLRQGQTIVDQGIIPHNKNPTIACASLLTVIKQLKVSHLVNFSVSLVAGDQWHAELDLLAKAFSTEVYYAKSTTEFYGIQNGYEQPLRLGVDRWLAIIAAYRFAKTDCCIIDAGSALTIDRVDATGKHQGGFILPGLMLSQQTLLANTGQLGLKASRQSYAFWQWGQSTETAVGNGCFSAILCLLNELVQRFQEEAQYQGHVYLTGGDAMALQNNIEYPVEYNADLVLDGLQIVTHHNYVD